MDVEFAAVTEAVTEATTEAVEGIEDIFWEIGCSRPGQVYPVAGSTVTVSLFLSWPRHGICQKVYTGKVLKTKFYPKVRKSQ